MSKIDTLTAKVQTGLARLRDEDETGAVLDDVPAWAVWTAAGVAVGVGAGALIEGTSMPFALSAPSIVVAAVLLVVLGLLGAAAAVVRITRVDPLTALGGNR